MKLYCLIIFLTFCFASCNLNSIINNEYDYDVHILIDENHQIETEVDYYYNPQNEKDSMVFKLNKAYGNITLVGNEVKEYNITESSGQKKIIVYLNEGEGFESKIHLKYMSQIADMKNVIMDSVGFQLLDNDVLPIRDKGIDYDIFTYKLNVEHPEDYFIYSNANVKSKDEKIVVSTNTLTSRLLLIFSRVLYENRTYGENDLVSFAFSEETKNPKIDFIGNKALEIIDFYNGYVCIDSISYLNILLNDYHEYSFYAKDNFVSLQNLEFEKGLTYLLAHEIAHHWCSNVMKRNISPDAFLNEGLAEYFAYMYFRYSYGEKEFKLLIERKQKEFEHFEYSINDISEKLDGEIREDILYRKGALILYEIEKRVGRESFANLICLIERNNTNSLKDFKQLLEKEYGEGTLELFDSLIN